jgi:hypothetical protein
MRDWRFLCASAINFSNSKAFAPALGHVLGDHGFCPSCVIS